MKIATTVLCAVITMALQTISSAQKTEVSVQQGKVRIETETESIAIDAGRKAVLAANQNLLVTVDDPMVDDVMEIYKWVEAEKKAGKILIDSASIQMVKIEPEDQLILAYLLETPNTQSAPTDICKIGPASILDTPKYYDLQGNLLAFELEPVTAQSGYYSVHFHQPVLPGGKFRYICVSKLSGPVSKEGSLRKLALSWSAPNQLNYFRFVLPESGIFIDASRPVTLVDNFDGRTAVTIRNYTGPIADGQTSIAFLWPEKDGTTLADIPPQYRGLRSTTEEDTVKAGREEMAKILAAGTYNDQSTPGGTLLTLVSALAHGDREAMVNLMSSDELKEIAGQQYDQYFGNQTFMRGMLSAFDFLHTSEWPENPENGYVHPVYLCRKGSLLRAATARIKYIDGIWYWDGLVLGDYGSASTEDPPKGKVTITDTQLGLDAANYQGLVADQLMTKWLFLGPIPIKVRGDTFFPSGETQKLAFDTEPINFEQITPKVSIDNKEYKWALLTSEYGIIDLAQVNPNWYLIGYAWAQIDMPEETTGILGIGADDSLKVWLNGELIHQMWTTRGVVLDNDLVPVTFKKGKNQLVLKIQNAGGAWGFSCRLLEK